MGADGAELYSKDYTAGRNNFLHPLFSQCNICLNGISITPSSGNYNYRAYQETLLVYGSDAAIHISQMGTGIWMVVAC
jgi:hypothetical protein